MKTNQPENSANGHKPTMAERLLSPDREQWADSATVLALLGIAADAQIADIGCGPGYYTVRLASVARRGLVHALDVEPEMLELCRQTVSAAGLENVRVARCSQYEFGLRERSLDVVFLSCVIHHADDPVRFLAAARRMLKEAGRCAMLEWAERESDFGPPLARRIGRDRLIALAAKAGYSDIQYHRLSEHQYLLTAASGDCG